MTTPTNRSFAAAALSLALLAAASAARADMAPPPPPAECAGRPDGTPCVMFNGTAGVCTTQTDARRPGRNWVTCQADAHECDRLAVGAACHGYLGRPAHCREFTDDRTHQRWRACQVDEGAYAADANGNNAPPNNAPPNNAPPNNAQPGSATRLSNATNRAQAGRGCSAQPGAAGGRAAVLMALAGIAAAIVRRRRKGG